jgi:hypothetical protein
MKSEDLLSLKKGSVVEVGVLMGAVSDEPVCFRLESISRSTERVILTFSLHYFSIPMEEWCVKIDTTSDMLNQTWVNLTQAKKALH